MATTEAPLSGVGEPLLVQAAVTNAMVDTNDALVPITENIALETLAIQIPASLVVASQENDNSNLFSAGVSLGKVDDNVMNLSMSQLNFMEAITAEEDHEASMDLSKAQQNFMESIAEMSQLMPEESIVATTALVAAAATTIVAEVVTEAATAASLPTVEEVKAPPKGEVPASEQPLAYIIMRHPVWIAPGFPTVEEIDESINYLDELIDALTKVNRELANEGISPGFETKFSTKVWTSAAVRTTASSVASTTTPSAAPYETLPSVNTSLTGKPAIPMPSPAATIKYYQGIRNTWVERRRYVESMGRDGNFCSCISKWDHAQGDVLAKLSNQSLEQAMVREASDAVTLRLQQRGFHMGMSDWDSQYAPSLCPTPSSVDDLYVKSTPIRVLKGRNDYISTMCALAMNAKSSIDVCTCYIFPHDPAQRYILLDLLPFVARYHGVTVRLLCDMMPVESSVVKSALRAKKKANKPKPPGAAVSRSGVAPTSFVESLPPVCPKFSDKAKASPESPMKFLEEVLDAAFSVPCGRFQIRWWCARDSQDKYRIKNHAKCLVFDGKNKGMALMGGSNIVPTVESGDSDLDMLVGGSKVVRKIGETFDYLWDSMDASTVISSTEIIESLVTLEDDDDDDEASQAPKFPKQAWTDKACRAALVRSEPCSAGADVIFRHVLGAIASAEKSVYMCMGHSNKPMALASALGDAVKRGVRVFLLVNSIYSCDLRVNQRDLFRSLKNLLPVAPGVEVYTTALPSMKKIRRAEEEKKEEETDSSPPFLHSKYTVVDGKWVAVGSWNVWTRSAFYEIEHELLIHSEIIAKELETKFQREQEATSVLLTSPEECDVFCPTGCPLCEPFGPFYM